MRPNSEPSKSENPDGLVPNHVDVDDDDDDDVGGAALQRRRRAQTTIMTGAASVSI